MSNAIMIWSGALASVPAGWYLCNGANSTPDLHAKFIRGAYAAGTRPSGTDVGAVGHTHTLGNSSDDVHAHALMDGTTTGGMHQHTTSAGANAYVGTGDKDLQIDYDSGHAATHTTQNGTASAHTHTQASAPVYAPPYLYLGYIMCAVAGIMPDAPIGGICLWTGSEADVPTDWAYCDGTSGTPDLRDKFLYGYKAGTNTVGATGGGATHTHTLTNAGTHTHPATVASGGASHTHTLGYSVSGAYVLGGSNDYTIDNTDGSHIHDTTTTSAGNHSHTVTTETFLERYYTLAYLIKVS